MGILFAYSLKSALCLTLFYLFYKVLLSKETFHRFNRFLLLGLVGLAIVIPLPVTSLFLPDGVETMSGIVSDVESAAFAPAGDAGNASATGWNWLAPVLIIYLAGICFFLLRNAAGLIRVLRIIRKGERVARADGIRLVVHGDKRIAPFSWMRYIILSRTDLDESGETILLHEQAHIRHHHTADLFLTEICVLLQWYNPAAWLLYRELQAIHEFEADEAVINWGVDARQYQLLLIKKAVGTRLYSMANSFNHSNLKKRITMMLQKRSNAWARLKCIYILPLAVVATAAFARPDISRPLGEISAVKVSDFIANPKAAEAEIVPAALSHPAAAELTSPETSPVLPDDTTVFTVVEKMPEFPGGERELLKFLNKNIMYPVGAQENGIQGRVVILFTVSSDGTLRDFEVTRGIDPLLDAEALRVAKTMPKWQPGEQRGKPVNVRYTVPITFKLPKPEHKQE